MTRTSRSHEEALEMLLGGYLTGRQDELNVVFGADHWGKVLKLSHNRSDWQVHRIARALGD